MIVVKVGGSLFRKPNLGHTLQHWLATLNQPVVIVPGGGAFADAIRELDTVHSLSESAAHWLAIHSLNMSRHFLLHLLDNSFDVLDCFDFFSKHDITPHTWAVTSDSLALAYAQHQNASRLILLKSVSKPDRMSWQEASALEIVDEYFPKLIKTPCIPTEVINFQTLLTSMF